MSANITELQGIAGLCQIEAGWSNMNLGGLIELYAFDERSIVSMPQYRYSFGEEKRYALQGTIMLKSNATFYRFQFTHDTAGFEERQIESDQGNHYEQSLIAFFPKDHPEIIWLKHRMRNRRYAFLYRDSNGIVKVLRNQRVKFDLNTQIQQSQKNGHNFQTRQLSVTPAPVLLDPITGDEVLNNIVSAFEETFLTYFSQFQNYPAGVRVNNVIQLAKPAFTGRSYQVYANKSMLLMPGRHYSHTDTTIIFRAKIEGATEIDVRYVTEDVSDPISNFNKQIVTFDAPYAAGASFQLSSAPISPDNLKIVFNDSLLLRHGENFNLLGDTVFLLFDGFPSLSDTDTFHCMWTSTGGANLTIQGYSSFVARSTFDIVVGKTYKLRQTAISNSVEVYLNDAILLVEGVDYQVNNNEEIEILQQIDKPNNGGFNDLLFFHAY